MANVKPLLQDFEFEDDFDEVEINQRNSADPIEFSLVPPPLPKFGSSTVDTFYSIQDESITPYSEEHARFLKREGDSSESSSFFIIASMGSICCGICALIGIDFLINPVFLMLGVFCNLSLLTIPSIIIFLCTGCLGLIPCCCFIGGWLSTYVTEKEMKTLSGVLLLLIFWSVTCIIVYPLVGLVFFLGSTVTVVLFFTAIILATIIGGLSYVVVVVTRQ